MNAAECVSQITLNDPNTISPLFDLLILAAQPGWAESDERDEIMEHLYLKLPDCRLRREEYIKSRASMAA